MKRVLMVSPHFPPDGGAAAHRVRLLAPYLREFGWHPTVLTLTFDAYEGRLDAELLDLVPKHFEVVRVRALSPWWTRSLGFGDLGLRALPGLWRACRGLLAGAAFDCFFVTIYPTYPALLGSLVKRRYSIPFVLDYQDPWVGSWGKTTGPSANGRPDLKSRLSRALAGVLEPIAVRAADAMTAVSEGTFDVVRERIPGARSKLCVEIPIGCEPMDFDSSRLRARRCSAFEPDDGLYHLSYVGTVLPAGRETLLAFLRALSLLKGRQPDLFASLRVHFVGTSNQSVGEQPLRVLPDARMLGVEEAVRELPMRVDYLDALSALVSSDGILLLGTSEHHYTASKLYPAVLARRPLLAIYHERSSVVTILKKALPPPSGRLVTYDDIHRPEARVEEIYAHLSALVEERTYDGEALNLDVLRSVSARSLAARLAHVFDSVAAEAGE